MSTAPPRPSSAWFDSATRWTQLTFVEDDPLHFDLGAWRDVMKRTRSNAICLSAGGYIAFYPSAVPYHYRSRFLGDRDLFGEVVDVARSLGMKVVARVDPHAIHDEAAQANPEWVARDRDDNPVEHETYPGIWLTDIHSTFHSEFVTDVAVELVREYDVDAVFANRWQATVPVSYSAAARTAFREETGLDLPASPWTDASWGRYQEFIARRYNVLLRGWADAVAAVRSDARFIPNAGPDPTRGLDADVAEKVVPFVVVDKQGRWGTQAIWSAGQVGRRSRGSAPERATNLITSVGPEQHAHRWKDSVDSPAELVTAMADGILHEANPWFTKFNARIVDDRWIAPVEQAYRIHEKIEPLYRSSETAYDVLLVEAQNVAPPRNLDEFFARPADEDGIYHALLEARIPFGYVSSARLSTESLQHARVVIVSDTTRLSDAQAEVLETFVRAGGRLIVTDRGTLFDQDATQRACGPLDALLGITRTGERRERVQNNYIQIMESNRVTAGYDGAQRIIGGTATVPVEAADGTRVPFRFVPDFPDLPMEEVYPREQARDAAVVTREFDSGGRTAYVAFNVGSIFWEAMQQDHGRLISNLVDWALDGDHLVRLDGLGLVDLAVRHKRDGVLVGLVNLDNAQSMRGQLHWVRPLEPQHLSVAAPVDAAGAHVRLIVSDVDLDGEVSGGRLRVHLPAIDVLELVEITWIREDHRNEGEN